MTPVSTRLVRLLNMVPYFQANPPDKDTDYFTVWLDYKF